MPNRDILQVREYSDVLVSEAEVQAALARMAAGIRDRVEGSDPVLLCVMNGGLFTTSELARRLPFPLQMDYLQVSRYREAVRGSTLSWLSRPRTAIAGRSVVVVDDILDRGETLAAVCAWCREEGAEVVLSAVLVEKMLSDPVAMAARPIAADYVAIQCPDRYLYGCGMDYRGYWRNLPAIYGVRDDYLHALEAAASGTAVAGAVEGLRGR